MPVEDDEFELADILLAIPPVNELIWYYIATASQTIGWRGLRSMTSPLAQLAMKNFPGYLSLGGQRRLTQTRHTGVSATRNGSLAVRIAFEAATSILWIVEILCGVSWPRSAQGAFDTFQQGGLTQPRIDDGLLIRRSDIRKDG